MKSGSGILPQNRARPKPQAMVPGFVEPIVKTKARMGLWMKFDGTPPTQSAGTAVD